MARKKTARRAGLAWIIIVLVTVTAGFCVVTSWEDKFGELDWGLPGLPLPDFVLDVLDNLGGGGDDGLNEPTGAMDVSGRLPGATLEVHFLDLGQADSILIKGPGASLLLDAGENNQGEAVVRYLKNAGARTLDYVIGTHPHSDHIGGLDTVIRELRVKNVILPVLPDSMAPTTETYLDLLDAVEAQGLSVTAAKPGKSYDLGDGAALEILGPVGVYTDLNNMSVVCRLRYGSTSFLFTGDAGTGAENDLLDSGRALRSDVLSVGHHGSDTSTGEAFLRAVSPRIAVISCGLDNSYGHPHREVVERLELGGVRILRTDLNGSVIIESDGERLAVSTAK